MEDREKYRTFVIEAIVTVGNGAQYWTNYDDEISTIAEGNERLQFLAVDQPDRSFRLIEVLTHTEDLQGE